MPPNGDFCWSAVCAAAGVDAALPPPKNETVLPPNAFLGASAGLAPPLEPNPKPLNKDTALLPTFEESMSASTSFVALV